MYRGGHVLHTCALVRPFEEGPKETEAKANSQPFVHSGAASLEMGQDRLCLLFALDRARPLRGPPQERHQMGPLARD